MEPQPSLSSARSGNSSAIPGGALSWIAVHADRLLAAAILGALTIKFVLIARININWDEFYFLELTHQYARGELTARFQTFHVHLFSWLPRLGWDVADQIVAGRVVMAVLSVASAFLTYALARRFTTRHGALFALLAYLSVSAVIEHGASFRVDPIVTFLSLLSLFAILCRPGGVRGTVLAGAAMAVATLVTVKTAFYLVAIGGVFWCIAPDLRGRAKLVLVFAASLSVAMAALYLLHGATLLPQEAGAAGTFLRASASKAFFDGVFSRAFDLIWMIIPNPLFWLMLTEGAVIAWALARKRAGWQAFLPLVLALPVLTPIFYRNAFDYFYPFILTPAAILVGLSFDKHRQAAPRPDGIPAATLTAVLVIVQCVILVLGNISKLPDDMRVQRQTIAAVRAIFPEPVPYIDGFGVLAGYPRGAFFMSSWGVENYRRAGEPVFAGLVARDQPPFVLADAPSLYGALVPGVTVNGDRAFLPEDVRFLQENYIRHWGMLFVAGKHLRSADGENVVAFDMAVGGEYRFDSAAPAVIDGSSVQPGTTVALAAGGHTIDLGEPAREATLRWAQATRVPELPPTDPLTFFHRKSWADMRPEMMRPESAH
jgi:hypothetical protein